MPAAAAQEERDCRRHPHLGARRRGTARLPGRAPPIAPHEELFLTADHAPVRPLAPAALSSVAARHLHRLFGGRGGAYTAASFLRQGAPRPRRKAPRYRRAARPQKPAKHAHLHPHRHRGHARGRGQLRRVAMTAGLRLFTAPWRTTYRPTSSSSKSWATPASPTSHAAKDFDGYLLFRSVTSVRQLDESLVANWMHSIPTQAAATKNAKLRFARGFLNYLVRLDLLPDNPAQRIHYLRQKVYKPYIYTLQEIHRILEAARGLQRRYPNRLTGWTMETFVLLALRLRPQARRGHQPQESRTSISSRVPSRCGRPSSTRSASSPSRRRSGKSFRPTWPAATRRACPPVLRDPFFAHPGGKYSKAASSIASDFFWRAAAWLSPRPRRPAPS